MDHNGLERRGDGRGAKMVFEKIMNENYANFAGDINLHVKEGSEPWTGHSQIHLWKNTS